MTNSVVTLTPIVRLVFTIAAGLYLGVAFAVLRRYAKEPPRSRLRRYHVIGVSAGTTLLVIGFTTLVRDLELNDAPLVVYGAPTGLLGIIVITTSLVLLFLDQGHPRPAGQRATDKIPDRHPR